jgi:hypothetical protein
MLPINLNNIRALRLPQSESLLFWSYFFLCCYFNNNFGSGLQIYSDYQMQQMSDNIHDPYGFTEDDFADNDDSR